MKNLFAVGLTLGILAAPISSFAAELLFTCKPNDPTGGPIYRVYHETWKTDARVQRITITETHGDKYPKHYLFDYSPSRGGFASVIWAPRKDNDFQLTARDRGPEELDLPYVYFYSSRTATVIDIKTDQNNPGAPNSQGARTDYTCIKQ